MSISSWLTFKLRKKDLHIDAVLKQLLECGWVALREDKAVFLPLGDTGDFNWTSHQMDSAALSKLISMKREAGELFGIVLHWESSDIGGNFLIDPELTLQVSLSVNRVLLNKASPHTHVSWYLERILPALDQVGGALSVEWSENA